MTTQTIMAFAHLRKMEFGCYQHPLSPCTMRNQHGNSEGKQKKEKGYYAGDAKWRFDVKSFGDTHPWDQH